MQSRKAGLPNINFLKNIAKHLTRAKFPAQFSTQHSALSTQHHVVSDGFLTQKQIDLPLCSAPHPSTLKKHTSAKNNSIYRRSFTAFSSGARLQCRHFSTLFILTHSILKRLVGRFSRVSRNEEWGCPKSNHFLRHPYRPYIKLSRSGVSYES